MQEMQKSFRVCFDHVLHLASEMNVEACRIADGRQQWRDQVNQLLESVRVSNKNIDYSSRHLWRLDGTLPRPYFLEKLKSSVVPLFLLLSIPIATALVQIATEHEIGVHRHHAGGHFSVPNCSPSDDLHFEQTTSTR